MGRGAIHGAPGHAPFPSGRPACPPLAAPLGLSRDLALAIRGPALPIPLRVPANLARGFGGAGAIDDIGTSPRAKLRFTLDLNKHRCHQHLLCRLKGALVVRGGNLALRWLHPCVLGRGYRGQPGGQGGHLARRVRAPCWLSSRAGVASARFVCTSPSLRDTCHAAALVLRLWCTRRCPTTPRPARAAQPPQLPAQRHRRHLP